ncbi:MAG: PAS domain-containing sensor histidine kinase [Bacteroidota bacterium]|nr:PAS domain-containing sensor histidine kinase [Bacteroidota bacterium]
MSYSENMQSSLEGLQFVLQNISFAILMETADRKVRFVNSSFCKLFQINALPEQLIGYDCAKSAEFAATLFKESENFVHRILEILEMRIIVNNEELLMKDGRCLVRDYIPVVFDKEQDGHLWVYKDVSDIKKLEAAQESQKRFYEKVLNNIPADIAIFDKQHKYLFVNKTGVKNDEIRKWLIGRDDFDYCAYRGKPIEQAVYRRSIFEQAVRAKETIEFADTQITPDGETIYNLRRFYPYTNEQDEIEFVVGYGINITSVKEKENQLRKSEETYRKVIDGIKQIAFVINDNLVIKYANPLWEKLVGVSAKESIGKGMDDFFSNDVVFAFQKDAINVLHDLPLEKGTLLTIIDRGGIEHFIQYSASRYYSFEFEEARIIFFLYDVTEQIIAEREMLNIISREKELNDLKSNFVNMASHEMRTPLTVIQSSAEILKKLHKKELMNPENFDTYINKITNEVSKMTNLMDELLLLSKIEKGKIEYNPELIDLPLFVRQLIKENFDPWQDKRSMLLFIKGQQQMVQCDKFMLHHILMNLFNNAFKYSLSQRPPVTTIRFRKNGCTLFVQDWGIGIPESSKPKLFNSFNRGDNVANISGSGLGLVIVKYFLEKHNKDLCFRSFENKGTIMAFDLEVG